ncbi:MAG: sugar ABC transporter ATP-binding protein [Thermoflexibacter sp.]|jgi:ribose transport system ATP-binding protein|nr:sugar ABC transporter ATP-binding protein [Thermoflexibacter sp.]
MLLQLHKIRKTFGSVIALQEVDFSLQQGEVHALCGENGAGKSTLMNILVGNFPPTSGSIVFKGQEIFFKDNLHATQSGISIVYQHLSLVNNMTVAENIFANRLPQKFGMIQYKVLRKQTQELLSKLNIADIDLDTKVSELSIGQKQMVEIAKALSKNPEILILDEPTASVTHKETITIFQIIRELKQKGVGIIYISHRLDEIFQIADRVSVLKDGKHQATLSREELNREKLINLMVGRDLEKVTKMSFAQKEVILEVKNLRGEKFKNINFKLYKGEILALAGLQGAGRTEVALAIFGADQNRTGDVIINHQTLLLNHPCDAIQSGIGYLPEERKTLGIFPEMSVMQNIISVKLKESTAHHLFNEKKAGKIAEDFKRKLNIVASSISQKLGTLSGGNQQKVVLAKWLLQDPQVLIIDEPTHGIDVGAKFEIYELLRDLAKSGKGIILISSELPEVIALADRILVMREGEIVGELDGKNVQENEILALAAL